MKEQRKLGAHYLVQFYNDVTALRQYYGVYIMELNKIKYKYKVSTEIPGKELQLDDNEMKVLSSHMENIRFRLNVIVPQFRTINKIILKAKSQEDFDNLYKKISLQFLIAEEDLTQIVQLLEDFLLDYVIDDLLTTAQDVYNAVYGTDQPK